MSSRILVIASAAALLCASSGVAFANEGTSHLLAGARAFRDGDFARALIELRVAEKLSGAGDATWYIGAALVKLERYDEALETFARAEELAPGQQDQVLRYYVALALYGVRLYASADAELAKVKADGPEIARQISKLRSDLEAAIKTAADHEAIDWYLARGNEALASQRSHLGRAYFREAAALARMSRPPYREKDAMDAVARAEQAIRGR